MFACLSSATCAGAALYVPVLLHGQDLPVYRDVAVVSGNRNCAAFRTTSYTRMGAECNFSVWPKAALDLTEECLVFKQLDSGIFA